MGNTMNGAIEQRCSYFAQNTRALFCNVFLLDLWWEQSKIHQHQLTRVLYVKQLVFHRGDLVHEEALAKVRRHAQRQ